MIPIKVVNCIYILSTKKVGSCGGIYIEVRPVLVSIHSTASLASSASPLMVNMSALHRSFEHAGLR